MRPSNTFTSTIRIAAVAALACSAWLVAPLASAAVYHHAMLGSTGTVDEKDQNEVDFKGARALFKQNANGKITLRYQIDAIDKGDWINIKDVDLYVRYRDNGPNARVLARLKAYNFLDGSIQTLVTVDSNNYPQTNDYQFHWERASGSPATQINPLTIYFVDVVLEKSGSGAPALESLMVFFAE